MWAPWRLACTVAKPPVIPADITSIRTDFSDARTHLGPVVCGDSVSKSSVFRELLRSKDRNLLCVAMEEGGILTVYDRSMEKQHADILIVRGISDSGLADKKRIDAILDSVSFR